MLERVRFALFVGACVMSSLGCEQKPNKPARPKNDAGQTILRVECDVPSQQCFTGCIKRQEERFCPSCCLDQLMLCDDGHPYSFESCDAADSSSSPLRPPFQK
ncbi:hypothetical protein [Polyangium sorediatum]|uniref:Lipoprotein n=1 Tax=Polyangium sorediatum TaxID=889274 RepID=A0ABT6NPQ5_9BACT|nr:hypothetical protein [Polyangium sorediatum]MDI1430278.1 hypothetical protein [Polyangium sorediatum]